MSPNSNRVNAYWNQLQRTLGPLACENPFKKVGFLGMGGTLLKKVLADFAVNMSCNWRRYCKALSDEKLIQIKGKWSKIESYRASSGIFSNSV